MSTRRFSYACGIAVSAAFLAGCMGDYAQNGQAGQAQGVHGVSGSEAAPPPFYPLVTRAYVAKVKNILTGLPATDDDVAQVMATPSQLKTLISTWQQSPQYTPKMVAFLSNAFQQSAVFASEFADQGVPIDGDTLGNSQSAMLVGNLRESFARTVLWLDSQGKPFNSAMATNTFMMTPPLAAYYAYLDNVLVDDQGKTTNNNQGQLATVIQGCTAQDFNNWRPVTIRQPDQGEATTLYTDTATLNTGSTLVLKTPRVGFFTTPAFFAGWQTNLTNTARVTTNQTFIVALGHAIDGTKDMMPQSLAALDANHAGPTTPCYACHVDLDPLRQFFRQAYTIHFSKQNNATEAAIPGMFAWDGVSMAGTHGIQDLGNGLATHPALAAAWVQKLCTYANDAPCLTADPEFQRVVQVFQNSQFSWSTLVSELFSSPLVTYASRTATATTGQGESFPVAKADHLCPLLTSRLKLNDICGKAAGAKPTGAMATVQLIASILPANGYSRGQVLPVLANDPSLFFRAGMENVCAILSTQVVDNGTTPLYDSSDPNTAIASMVHDFMGLGASVDTQPISILKQHFNAAVQGGATATQAMQSTFVTACLSPSVIGIGQ